MLTGTGLGCKSSYVAPGGPVERMNSAKSPIESRSTLASLACALSFTFAPLLAIGLLLASVIILGVGGGLECSAVLRSASELVRDLSFFCILEGWANEAPRGESGGYIWSV